MSRDKTGRSKWSPEQVENSNTIDLFLEGSEHLSDFGSTSFSISTVAFNV